MRAFGVGGSNSFDIFLGGEMGVAVDLIMEDGARTHFVHQQPNATQTGDTYLAVRDGVEPLCSCPSRLRWRFLECQNHRWLDVHFSIPTASSTAECYRFDRLPRSPRTQIRDGARQLWRPYGHCRSLRQLASFQRMIRSIGFAKSLLRRVGVWNTRYDSGGRMFRATDSDGHVRFVYV